MAVCSNQHRLYRMSLRPYQVKVARCRRKATTFRVGWSGPFGQKGEPGVGRVRYPLCEECARQWDDSKAEATAEARMS